MSLREFHYVIAIAEEGSISKAARRLHIAQPSLSLYLQRLEQRLETPLFDRNTIPMTLTSAGELYVGKARKILGLEQELHRELHDMSDMKKGHVTLGMTVYWSLRFLPKVLPVFHSLYPGIGIGIREGGALDVMEWARNNETDLTVMTQCDAKDRDPELEYEDLRNNEAYLVLAPSHPLCRRALPREAHSTSRPWLDFSLLKDEPFLLQVEGCTLRHIASHLFRQYDFTPHISHEVQNSETAESLATAGIGAAFSVEDNSRFHDAATRPNYFSVGLPPVTWTLTAAWKKNRYQTQAARRFLEVSRSVYATVNKKKPASG